MKKEQESWKPTPEETAEYERKMEEQRKKYYDWGYFQHPKLTIGVLPPPGCFSNISKNGKPLSQAYITAKNGGKHAPLISRYRDTPTKEIQKSIWSHEKQIAKHKDKIMNSSKRIQAWDTLDPRHREHLVNAKWADEITMF